MKGRLICSSLEGNKNQIASFQEFARENKPEDAKVSGRVFEDYEGYVIGIVDYMHLIQVEQLSKGIPAILSIDKKQDKMLEKQDTTIQILGNISEELRSVHEDTTDMKSTLSRIEVDVKYTEFSLSAFIEEKYQKLEGEIAEIKATLAKMQAAG